MSKKETQSLKKEARKDLSRNRATTDDPHWKKVLEFISKPIPLFALNLVCATLFFPYKPSSTLPALSAVLISSYLGWLGWTKRRKAILVLAFLTGMGGLLWGILGIFVVSDRPLYCLASSHTSSPFQGKLIRIGKDKTLATLFVVSDPIRSSTLVKHLVLHLLGNVIFIQKRRQGNREVVTLPLRTAIRHEISGSNPANSQEELVIAGFVHQLTISEAQGRGNIDVGVGRGYLPLVDLSIQVPDNERTRWATVLSDSHDETNTAIYVVLTDVGLSAFTRNNIDLAMTCLEEAYPFAPSGIEKARNRVLLGRIADGILVGNLGVLQSLGYFNEAMVQWPMAARRHPIIASNLPSALDKWLYTCLREAFYARQSEFPEWRRILAYHGGPKLSRKGIGIWNGTPVTEFDLYEESDQRTLLDAEIDRMLSLIDKDGNCRRLEEDLKQRKNISEQDRRWVAHRLILTLWTATYKAGESHSLSCDALSKAATWAVSQMPGPWRSMDAGWLTPTWCDYLTSAYKTGSFDEATFQSAFIKEARQDGFPLLAQQLEELVAFSRSKEPHKFSGFTEVADTSQGHWWNTAYLDWFSASLYALPHSAIWQGCKIVWECRGAFESIAYRLSRDQSGTGEVFIPGVALSLRIANDAGIKLGKDWETIYEETLGAKWSAAKKNVVVRKQAPRAMAFP